MYGWVNLNKKNDNYSRGTPIDCYDPKTGLYQQVQGRYYNSKRGYWSFSDFKRELEKIFEDMVCFCFDKDGKIVERIYKMPENVVKNKGSVTIVKYNLKGNVYDKGWYEEYRITDESELKKANEILTQILEEEGMKKPKRKITYNRQSYDGYITVE